MASDEHRQGRDLVQEREHRKYNVAAALRLFAAHGVTHGAAGDISARDPEHEDAFWVNPALRHFSRILPADLLLVDRDGRVLEGDGELNRAAFAIHSRLHRARPEIVGAAHAHSSYGKVWSTTGRLLQPLTQDGCAFFEDHALYATYRGVVFDAEEEIRLPVLWASARRSFSRTTDCSRWGTRSRRRRGGSHHGRRLPNPGPERDDRHAARDR